MSNRVSHIALPAAALLLACAAQAQTPVDDYRVSQLENEIRRLQQQVDYQARRIEALEQAARITPPVLPGSPAVRSPDNSPVWLSDANWDRVKTGMSVQEVISILGRPTSTRNDDTGKLTLVFYAMELGEEKYLSGTIRFEDSVVAEINRPVLK